MGNILSCRPRPAHVGSVATIARNICPTVTPPAEADYHEARNAGVLRPWCALVPPCALARVSKIPWAGRPHSHEPLQVRLTAHLAQN